MKVIRFLSDGRVIVATCGMSVVLPIAIPLGLTAALLQSMGLIPL